MVFVEDAIMSITDITYNGKDFSVPTTPTSQSPRSAHSMWLTSPDVDTPMSPTSIETFASPVISIVTLPNIDSNITDATDYTGPTNGDVDTDINLPLANDLISASIPQLSTAAVPCTPSPKRRLEYRKPTAFHGHRRGTPPKALDLDHCRRARIYSLQPPVPWAAVSGSVRSLSGGSLRCGIAAGGSTDAMGGISAEQGHKRRAASVSPTKLRFSGKKVASPNAKLSSMGMLASVLGMPLKKLRLVGENFTIRKGKVKAAGSRGGNDQPAGKKRYKTLISPRSFDSSGLKGFARAQDLSREGYGDENGGVGVMLVEDPDADDANAPSPVRTSPLRHQYPQYLNVSSSPSVLENPFGTLSAPDSASGSTSFETRFLSPSRVTFAEMDVSGDTEMVPPLTPVTNNSPASISSSMRRAKSKGKMMRVLGHEAYEAYEGILFAGGSHRNR